MGESGEKKKIVYIVTCAGENPDRATLPFMLATAWTPFTSLLPLLWVGLLVYAFGIGMLFKALKAIVETEPDGLFLSGPYRVSRNPLYVAATAVFLGICAATANILLLLYLVSSVLLQHWMILAEERMCKQRFRSSYETYMKDVPRYLPIFWREITKFF